MIKRYFLPYLFLFLPAFLFSQTDSSNLYYWVKFKDKNHNQFSLNNPQQFLAQASITRRASQNIPIDSSDLPITQAYIDSLVPYIDSEGLVHRLKWFNMVVVHISDSLAVGSIKKLAFVDSIAPIGSFPNKTWKNQNKFEEFTPVDQRITYPDVHGAAFHQLNMMNADLLHQMGNRGRGIIIAMMDNGLFHADVLNAFDSVRLRILDTWDFVHNRKNVYADGSHATETFSCIAANMPGKYVGTAPDASFVLLQTEDNNAEWVMEEYNWAAAAEFADSVGAQIFSTSLGYTTFDNNIGNNSYSDLTGNKTVITQAANTAASKGILVFNSAGNDGGPLPQYWHYICAPADGDSVIAIGAVDSARNIAGFSSSGPNAKGRVKPDLCAQGNPALIISPDGNISTSTGTSFSCPIMAGCAASLWSAFPEKTAKEIYTAIVVTADRFWTPDSSYGYGIPNFYNSYLFLKTNYDDTVLHMDNTITVYPNPFSDYLNISAYSDTGTISHHIEIFDMLGQKLWEREYFIRNKTFEVVSVSEARTWQAGKYVMRFDRDNKRIYKLVKAK